MSARKDQDPEASRPLIVIGSSAGGIEALSILVSRLPPAFPAPILLVQHLDPRRPSHLAEILERRASLPVVSVVDKATLEPGTIYVVPANRNVQFENHSVSLTEGVPGAGPTPSVDLVLTSAAQAFGERVIAVILTGTGSDGAAGARRVKAAGGTVIAQDPQTARFPSMPSALGPTIVDVVAAVDAIGPLLHDLVSGAFEPSRPDEERLLDAFLSQLRERSGIDFASYKRSTVIRRLQRRMAATGNRALSEYVAFLREHPEEYARLTSALLIKVTEFMRDPDLFEHLRTDILPPLIADARRRGRELRLWSAGCSTGEEAYSLAIDVADLLGEELDDWTVRIFATDVDGEAVAFARRGIYPPAALDDVPPETIRRHFAQSEGHYAVRKHIRALTVFGQHDLAVRAPFPRIDLALCRNVLIYFTPELQKRALQLFAFALRDGGMLVLGKAETTSPLADYFAVEDSRLKIYRRRGERLFIPPMRIPEPTPLLPARVPRRRTDAALVAVPDTAGLRTGVEHVQAILEALPIGLVVVNPQYDVTLINPVARRLLGIHGAAIGKDLIHLLEDLGGPEIRAAVDAALAGQPGSLTLEMRAAHSAEAPRTSLRIDFLRQDDGGEARGVALVIRDVTEEVERLAGVEQAGESAQAEIGRLQDHIEGYVEANRRLLADNEELTRVNSELRGTNEELLVANEEVQAATEEVETLNEELQSTNEELETLNEELQATVEELNTTNDDMQARTEELQQLAASLEEQSRRTETARARLAAVIEAQPDAILVVDGQDREVMRNEAYGRIVAGRTFEAGDGVGPVSEAALRERTAQGEAFVLQLLSVDGNGGRHWYEAYGRPVPADVGVAGGGILFVHDITDLSLRRLQQEFVAVVVHELRTPLTALRGYLQMLGSDGDGSSAEDLATLAGEQAGRLTRLVDELFDVARAESGQFAVERTPLDLGELVDQTVRIARSLSSKHHVVLERQSGPFPLEGDSGRLQQLLLNLISNAIVHGPDSPEIEIRLRRLRRRAELEVEDHGPGIAPADRGRVFSRFNAGEGRRRGLGLGLYISREIVHAHGGTIDFDSEPGEGTTFTVRLPLASADGSRAAPATSGRRRSTRAG